MTVGIKFYLIAMILLVMSPAWAGDADNLQAAQVEFAKGKKLFAAKKYKEAQAVLETAAALGSRDGAIQYYLATAALQNGDQSTFKRALARNCVHYHPKRGIGYQSLMTLLKYDPQCWPYPCTSGASGILSRFVKKQMPIKICVTPGLMLPQPYRGKEGLRPNEITNLLQLIKPAGFYDRLERDPGYESGYAQAVIAGAGKWDWARSEGILNYQFVQTPQTADIVVMWCPNNERQHTAFTQAMNSTAYGKKIIMQIQTNDKNHLQRDFLEWIAAHEFGHCWGMCNHSIMEKDLMSANANSTKPHGGFSENDKLTLRALYDVAPNTPR